MKNFFKKAIKIIENIGYKINSTQWISTVGDAFIDIMPIIIAGSVAIFFSGVICSPKNGLAQFDTFSWLANFQVIFNGIDFACMGLISIFLVYSIASRYAEHFHLPKTIGGFVGLGSFFAIIPHTTSVVAEISKETVEIGDILAYAYTSSQGMFLAIVMGIISIKLLSLLWKADALKIKMPEGVPPGIMKSFEGIIPVTITIILFGILAYVFEYYFHLTIPDAIYSVLQTPLLAIMAHPLGVVALVLIAQLLWVIGIHGVNMVEAVRSSVGLAAITANIAAYTAGEPLEHIFTYTFWNTFCTIGGSGCTIGLLISIYLVSTRSDHRAIAKLSALPSVFGINEPVIFGMPIVLNPILALPFIVAPVVSALIGYFATYIGFASPAMYTVPWTTPPILNAYISTGGSIGTVITQIICIICSVLIYLPFVKVCNYQKKTNDENAH